MLECVVLVLGTKVFFNIFRNLYMVPNAASDSFKKVRNSDLVVLGHLIQGTNVEKKLKTLFLPGPKYGAFRY
jgi:hypothetical protein